MEELDQVIPNNYVIATKLPEGLKALLQCAICGLRLSRCPLGILQTNRLCCHECIQRNILQPLPFTRSILLERVLEGFAVPCMYKAQGCPGFVMFNKGSDHEKVCPHRVFKCPMSLYTKCTWSGKLSKVGEHCKHMHIPYYYNNAQFIIKIDDDFQTCYLFENANIVLAIFMKGIKDQKAIWIKVVNIANGVNLPSVLYSLKFLDSNTSLKKVVFPYQKALNIENLFTDYNEEMKISCLELKAGFRNKNTSLVICFLSVRIEYIPK